MDTLAVLAEHLPELPVVQVEPYEGRSATGPKYGAPVDEQVVIDQKRRLVRDVNGDQVVSETTLIARVGANVPVGSRITMPDGRKPVAIAVSTFRDHGQPELPAHLEIACE